jgi:hypothetical protein
MAGEQQDDGPGSGAPRTLDNVRELRPRTEAPEPVLPMAVRPAALNDDLIESLALASQLLPGHPDEEADEVSNGSPGSVSAGLPGAPEQFASKEEETVGELPTFGSYRVEGEAPGASTRRRRAVRAPAAPALVETVQADQTAQPTLVTRKRRVSSRRGLVLVILGCATTLLLAAVIALSLAGTSTPTHTPRTHTQTNLANAANLQRLKAAREAQARKAAPAAARRRRAEAARRHHKSPVKHVSSSTTSSNTSRPAVTPSSSGATPSKSKSTQHSGSTSSCPSPDVITPTGCEPPAPSTS